MQKCKFIMKNLRVTQGYGRNSAGGVDYTSYSHTGSYAADLAGADTGCEFAYAPCDIVVRRIHGVYNAVWLESLEEVMCADGNTRKLIFMLLHINKEDMEKIGIRVGKIFRQGEIFYKEGCAGATGSHIHLEVGLSPFTGTGWYKTSIKDSMGNNVWRINMQVRPHDVFILDDGINILSDGGIKWVREKENTDKMALLSRENESLKEENERLSDLIFKIAEIVKTETDDE